MSPNGVDGCRPHCAVYAGSLSDLLRKEGITMHHHLLVKVADLESCATALQWS